MALPTLEELIQTAKDNDIRVVRGTYMREFSGHVWACAIGTRSIQMLGSAGVVRTEALSIFDGDDEDDEDRKYYRDVTDVFADSTKFQEKIGLTEIERAGLENGFEGFDAQFIRLASLNEEELKAYDAAYDLGQRFGEYADTQEVKEEELDAMEREGI